MTIAMCPEASASGSIEHVITCDSDSQLTASPVLGELLSGFVAVGAGAYATAEPPRNPALPVVGCPTPA